MQIVINHQIPLKLHRDHYLMHQRALDSYQNQWSGIL